MPQQVSRCWGSIVPSPALAAEHSSCTMAPLAWLSRMPFLRSTKLLPATTLPQHEGRSQRGAVVPGCHAVRHRRSAECLPAGLNQDRQARPDGAAGESWWRALLAAMAEHSDGVMLLLCSPRMLSQHRWNAQGTTQAHLSSAAAHTLPRPCRCTSATAAASACGTAASCGWCMPTPPSDRYSALCRPLG